MKLKNLFSVYSILLLSVVGVVACVKDTDYELPDLGEIRKDIPKFDGNIITFAQASSSATADVAQYTNNDAIEGYVISSDEGGNFYKKIYIQNAEKTAGISVAINKSGLYTEFPIGAKVQIRLKGLTTQINNGGLEIGYDIYTSSSGRKSVGQMAEAVYKKHVYNLQEVLKPKVELTKADPSVDVLKTETNVNQLITLKNVSFESAAIGKTFHVKANDAQNGTNYNLVDTKGKKIIFRTSRYAKFIDENVPAGVLDVTGVLTKYGSTYQFMINNTDDITVVGGGTNTDTSTVTELDASTATVKDYQDGKTVKLRGKITLESGKPHFKLSDNTMIQIYAPKSVFDNISQTSKDKLKIDGQEITVTGVFTDYKNPKTGDIIKEIVYSKESDLEFGTTPNVSITELDASKATVTDYIVGKTVKLHGTITLSENKSYIKFSDGTMIQIYAPNNVFTTLSEETKNKLKSEGQEITVTGVFTDYTPKTGATIKEIVYSKESDLVFGKTPNNDNGGNSNDSKENIFDFENISSNSNSYTNEETLTAKDGTTLTYKARTDLTNNNVSYAINGKGLMLHQNKSNPYIKITFTKKIKTLKFKYKGAFTGENDRKLVIYDGDENSTTELSSENFSKTASGEKSIEINKTGNVTITIKSTSGQIVVDDIEWIE